MLVWAGVKMITVKAQQTRLVSNRLQHRLLDQSSLSFPVQNTGALAQSTCTLYRYWQQVYVPDRTITCTVLVPQSTGMCTVRAACLAYDTRTGTRMTYVLYTIMPVQVYNTKLAQPGLFVQYEYVSLYIGTTYSTCIYNSAGAGRSSLRTYLYSSNMKLC